MVLLIILGVVVFITFAVLGVLFFMLGKEGQKKEVEKAVPLTDLSLLKNELSNQVFERNELKDIEKDNEIIPVYEPKETISIKEEPPSMELDLRTSKEDDAYKKRAQDLEDELLAISKKADGQSDEARQMIITLTNENAALKSQKADLEQAQQKLTELQEEAGNLKTDNINLQTQLEATNAKVSLLEDQMTAVKLQMGEELSRANATVTELAREKEAILSAPKPDADEMVSLRKELEVLRTEHTQLRQQCDDLEKNQRVLSESNANLAEKNDLLQYELVKARAQTSGLERVSYNYKNQLEDFFKKVNSVQVVNDHLSETKNRLEGMVEEIKSQNEDLIKKNHLNQFELQKNHLRLQELEREYEDLKLRAQQHNQQ